MVAEFSTGHTDGQELHLPSALRPYQWEGVSFLARERCALLADEIGLGKTVQASVALRLALKGIDCDRALVVAPTALTLNWERELVDCSPKRGPGAMRVSEALRGQETKHETTHGRRDHPQTATSRG